MKPSPRLRAFGKICALAAWAFLRASIASAQPLSLGVVGGGFFHKDFINRYERLSEHFLNLIVSDDGGFVIGPAAEYRLSERFAVEGAALYKPLHYEDAPVFQNGVIASLAPNTVVTWQFPVLLRYRAPVRGLYAFLEGGPSFRATGNLNQSDPSHVGVTAGAGLEIPWRKLRFAPSVRYTRWRRDPAYATARTRPDQVEFLAAVHYDSGLGSRPVGDRLAIGAVFAASLTDHGPKTSFTSIGPNESSLVFANSPLRQTGVIGPKLELRLSRRWSVEANALPRSFRSLTRTVEHGDEGLIPLPFESTSGGLWEFPVLLKDALLSRSSVRPVVEFGPSFRLRKDIGGAFISPYGVTLGAGVEFSVRRVRFGPAVRFTHWGPETQRSPGGSARSDIFRNQVQVVAGVSF